VSVGVYGAHTGRIRGADEMTQDIIKLTITTEVDEESYREALTKISALRRLDIATVVLIWLFGLWVGVSFEWLMR